MAAENKPSISEVLKLASAKSELRSRHAELTPTMLSLLEDLSLAHAEGHTMTVMQAMALSSLGSPATMHRRLTTLRREGYLRFGVNDEDSRVKYLLPTEKTTAIFEELSKIIGSKN